MLYCKAIESIIIIITMIRCVDTFDKKRDRELLVFVPKVVIVGICLTIDYNPQVNYHDPDMRMYIILVNLNYV